MATAPVQHERRASQRFPFQLPVALKFADREFFGVTQDVSARGALIYSDVAVNEGDTVEFTLMLPSEITLTESMRVRCRGRALRVCGPEVGAKFGMALLVQQYEFLSEPQEAPRSRVSSTHSAWDEEPDQKPFPSRASD